MNKPTLKYIIFFLSNQLQITDGVANWQKSNEYIDVKSCARVNNLLSTNAACQPPLL